MFWFCSVSAVVESDHFPAVPESTSNKVICYLIWSPTSLQCSFKNRPCRGWGRQDSRGHRRYCEFVVIGVTHSPVVITMISYQSHMNTEENKEAVHSEAHIGLHQLQKT